MSENIGELVAEHPLFSGLPADVAELVGGAGVGLLPRSLEDSENCLLIHTGSLVVAMRMYGGRRSLAAPERLAPRVRFKHRESPFCNTSQ